MSRIVEKINININNFSNAIVNIIEVEEILQVRKLAYTKIISYSGDKLYTYYDIQIETITMMGDHLNNLISALLGVSASGSIKIDKGEAYLNDYFEMLS